MFMLLLLVTLSLNMKKDLESEVELFKMEKEMVTNLIMEIATNKECKMILVLVVTVTTLISVYSKSYMSENSYELKKFMKIMMMFSISMMMLLLSTSMLSVMMFWEMLGLTSFFLILFYPNQTSSSNGKMTAITNRIGDVMLMVVMSLMLNSELKSINLVESKMAIMMIVVCGMTKSAQFPMSAWLPAAMSAPTPISAMVHSSTLVAAGLVVYMKIVNHMVEEMWKMTMMLGSVGMMMGGVMAIVEKDFKKIIAYSTMSQISMMVMFVSMKKLELCTIHMTYHGMFKSMLFCVAGQMFVMKMGSQSKEDFSYGTKSKKMKVMMTMSIFNMSGLMFSASMKTKHFVMDMMIMEEALSNFMVMLMSSTITMLYSIKMIMSMKSNLKKMKKNKFMSIKSMEMEFFLIINIIMIFVIKEEMKLSTETQVSHLEGVLMTMIMLVLVSMKTMKMKKLVDMGAETMMMVKFFYGWSRMMLLKYMNSTLQSDLMLKSIYMSISWKEGTEKKKKNYMSTMMKMSMLLMLMLV